MNGLISMSIATSSKTSAASATGSSKHSSGSGFASALIQVIGGTGTENAASTSAQSLSSPFAMLAIPVAGEEVEADISASLAQLLDKIAALLQQELDGDGQSVTDAGAQELLSLLASLQATLQPTLLETDSAVDNAVNKGQTDLLHQLGLTAHQADSLLKAIRAMRSQLTDVSQPSVLQAEEIGQLLGLIKEAVDKLAMQSTMPNRPLSAAYVMQPIAQMSGTEQPFREQIARWSSNVSAVQSNDQTNLSNIDDGVQTVWSLQQNELAKSAGEIAPKPAAPALVPAQQFAEHLQKFAVKQFLLSQGNGVTEARLQLQPEHLGQVDVRLMMRGGQLTAQFMIENGLAREMLETQMSQLRAALVQQGLQVERLEVVQQPVLASHASFLQQEQRRNGSGGQQPKREQKDGYESASAFQVELERSTTLREIGYGSSLNVIA